MNEVKMPTQDIAQNIAKKTEQPIAEQQGQSGEHALERILEAVLSVSDAPLSTIRLANLFPEDARPSSQDIVAALGTLASNYQYSSLELVKLGSGYRFQTRVQYAQWINKLFEVRPPKLSRALLETLSIIAYQQPVTRADIQEVRGVSVSSDIIQKLLERDWVKKIGERDVPGRPSLFATTPEFLNYFNLGSLKDLPELHEPRELEDIAREMGEALEEVNPDPEPATERQEALSEPGEQGKDNARTSFNEMVSETNSESN